MSISDLTTDTLYHISKHKKYSFNEAIELMKLADQLPTGNISWNWVNKNGNVAIGYNTQINKIKL